MPIHQPSPSLRRSAEMSLQRSQESPDLLSSGTLGSSGEHLALSNNLHRDSEASAPAEFPPEQPEADLVADGDQYGAEEAEDEEEDVVEGGEAAAADPDAMEQDSEMAGAEGDAAVEESDDGSEDLEAESSGSEDEELEEEEEVAGEGDADMDMDGVEKPHANGSVPVQADAVMAH